MVEAGAKQVPEAQVVGALEAAHTAIKQIVAAIDELKAAIGKPKVAVKAHEIPADFRSHGREARSRARSPTRCASRTSSRATRRSTR